MYFLENGKICTCRSTKDKLRKICRRCSHSADVIEKKWHSQVFKWLSVFGSERVGKEQQNWLGGKTTRSIVFI
jgi:hypothetical protein